MTAAPDASVIVVTWDGRDLLAACLEGLAAQTVGPARHEVVVVDNASTDGTAEWLAGRDGVRVLAQSENLGFAAGNNVGAEHARGRWLVLLNNDAVPAPDFVERLLDAGERSGAAAVAGRILDRAGAQVEFGGSGLNWLGFGFQRSSWQAGFRETAAGAPLPFACGGAMAVRRDAFLRAGGFDADYFAYYEDVDLGWRLNLAGERVVYAPDASVRHVRHATSSRFSDGWRHRHWFKNILQTLLKDAEHLGKSLPAGLAVLQSRVASFHATAAAARARGDEAETERYLEIASGAAEGLAWTLERLDDVLAKRERVQALRRVSDRELHERFGFALDFGPETEHWSENRLAVQLARTFDLSGLFGPALHAAPVAAPAAADAAELARLRHELRVVRESASWRMTGPVRALLDALRGRG